ncbi:MAG: hypothetical protein NT062_35795 [Proteobacteria bacterium]|nr:hypothetical protein [Pseudomonadota bacterium]
MKFPLTDQLIAEARRFELRSACRDCFYFVGGACAHAWPDEGQGRWPLDAVDPATGARPEFVSFCKEFELK